MSLRKVSLVILATMVIFATGVVTGGLLVRRTARVDIGQPQPFWGRFENTRRAVDHLRDLTPEQRRRIDEIVRDNQELIAEYFRILEPDVQQVFRRMREGIHDQLTAEQSRRFDELSRNRLPRGGDRRSTGGFNPRSNPVESYPPEPSSPRSPLR